MKNYGEVRLIERKCGGWLALTAVADPLQIGSTGGTKEEAVARLGASVAACRVILDGPDKPVTAASHGI